MPNENTNTNELDELKRENLVILSDAIEAFQELLDIQYDIVVARRGSSYEINLVFLERNFVHMAGLEYLTDIPLVRELPNIYNRIIANDSFSEYIKNQLVSSEYFDDIVGRLYSIIDLRDNFYNAKDNKHYKFMSKEYGNYTSIKYDYIIKSEYNRTIYYYFLRYDEKSSNPNQCVIVSLFIQNEIDYSKGQAIMILLEKTEINKTSNTKTIIYKK